VARTARVVLVSIVDFGRTANDYSRHRAGFPSTLLDRLAERGIGRPGQEVVDLGTGTGSLARLFARRRAAVTGVDPAEALLVQARELDREAGVDIRYVVGTAEATGLPTAGADVVAAGQCWHWFRPREATAEVWRLLRPGGSVVIAHFDWLPLPGTVVAATEALIQAYNPAWALGGGTGLYPRWLTDLRVGGFTEIETFSYDLDVPYARADWVGRTRASAGIAATLDPLAVEAFSAELNALLLARYPADPLPIPHRVWAVTAQKPL
jgi:SAM-dependent methyltransferase